LILFVGIGVFWFGVAHAILDEPTFPRPSNGATVEQPVILQWSNANFPQGAAGGYVVEVFGGNFFRSTLWAPQNSFDFKDYPTKTSTFGLLSNTEHSWRVRACFGTYALLSPPANQESECGPWSNSGTFWTFTPTIGKPKLVAPTNTLGKTVSLVAPLSEGNPYREFSLKLEWEKSGGADRYKVVLEKTFGTPFSLTFENITDTFWWIEQDPTTLLFRNTSYKWKVIPVGGKVEGPVSETWDFFVGGLALPPPPAPTLTFPERNAKVVYPLVRLEWSSKATEDVVYLWEVSSSFFGKAAGLEGETRNTFVSDDPDERDGDKPRPGFVGKIVQMVVDDPKREEIYTWQVRACRKTEGGETVNCSSPAGPRTFTLVFAKPEITSPTGGETIGGTPFTLRWDAPLTQGPQYPIRYLWEILRKSTKQKRLSGILEESSFIERTRTPLAVVRGFLEKGDFIARVKVCAKDEEGEPTIGCSDWGTSEFSTPDPIYPEITGFGVTPSIGSVDISWSVLVRAGGEPLRQIEVWRAFDINGDRKLQEKEWGTSSLKDIPTGNVLQHKDTYTDETSNLPDGVYWYGIHVVDLALKCITQEGERCETTGEGKIVIGQRAFDPIKVRVVENEVIVGQEDGDSPAPGEEPEVGTKFGGIEVDGLPSHGVFARGESYIAPDDNVIIAGDFKNVDLNTLLVEFLDNATGKPMAGVGIVDASADSEFITFGVLVDEDVNPGETKFTDTATLKVSFSDDSGDPLFVVGIPVAVRDKEDKRPPPGLTLPRDVFQKDQAPQDLFDTLQKIVQWIFGFTVALSLIFLILAVFQFVTGGGDPQKTSEARQKLLYAVIGLAIGFVVLGIPAIIRNIVV